MVKHRVPFHAGRMFDPLRHEDIVKSAHWNVCEKLLHFCSGRRVGSGWADQLITRRTEWLNKMIVEEKRMCRKVSMDSFGLIFNR